MYQVVYAQEQFICDAVKRLKEKVIELKKDGWVEQGGVSVSVKGSGITASYLVAQAMVKKEE